MQVQALLTDGLELVLPPNLANVLDGFLDALLRLGDEVGIFPGQALLHAEQIASN